MPASPASQIIMKNGIAAQSCTTIIASGASTVLASQGISEMPLNQPTLDVAMPFGCSSSRQITAMTTAGGSTGRKKIALTIFRPRNIWSNNNAAASDAAHTGTVAPTTNTSVLTSAVRNSLSLARLRKLSRPTNSGGLSRS